MELSACSAGKYDHLGNPLGPTVGKGGYFWRRVGGADRLGSEAADIDSYYFIAVINKQGI